MKKSHIAIGTFVIIFKIMVIIAFVYVGSTIMEIRAELAESKKLQLEIQDNLKSNQKMTQEQINEISTTLLSTKQTLSNEINELKASTSSDFSGVIENVIRGVVSVGTDVAQGSGFIISDDGYVITNAHVLSGAHYARVLTYGSDQWISADLIDYDSTIDVAILKIPQGSYTPLEFGDSSQLKVGEKVIALGNPLGLSFSVSEGIISALKRIGPNNLPVYIQIDTPLNSGNSGGPLISKQGKVIGINNFKIANSDNLGFALESNQAEETINALLERANQTIRI